MPLGFAKSGLTTQYSTGLTRDGAMRAFTNDATQPTGSGGFTLNKAATYTVSYSTAPYVDSTEFSGVIWMRINGANGNIDSPASRYIYHTDLNEQHLWGFVMGEGTNLSYMNLLNSGGNRLIQPYGSTYTGTNKNPDFLTALCDGSWKCLMISMKDPIQTGTNCWFIGGSSTNEANADGNNFAAPHSTIDSSEFKYIALRNNKGGHADSLNYESSFETGPGFELGPIWLYDSYLDFTSSTVRGYFYNASNVDGFVDGGSDGTQGGAPSPDVYMYHNASTLVVAGDSTPTVNTVTHNGGAIVVVPSSEGPGSGDTL